MMRVIWKDDFGQKETSAYDFFAVYNMVSLLTELGRKDIMVVIDGLEYYVTTPTVHTNGFYIRRVR